MFIFNSTGKTLDWLITNQGSLSLINTPILKYICRLYSQKFFEGRLTPQVDSFHSSFLMFLNPANQGTDDLSCLPNSQLLSNRFQPNLFEGYYGPKNLIRSKTLFSPRLESSFSYKIYWFCHTMGCKFDSHCWQDVRLTTYQRDLYHMI